MRRDVPGQVTVRSEAMATDFHVTIAHNEPRYARQAAAAAFQELEWIDGRLSRFVASSDVARINRSSAEESLVVAPCTVDCLRAALELEITTGGSFNVAFASQPPRRAADAIALARDRPAVRVLAPGVLLDLGGIGKGFALDQMAAVLAEWGLDRVLLQASGSTALAGQPPSGRTGWPIRFGPLGGSQGRDLVQSAFSGSGIDVKGHHIVDPRTGEAVKDRRLAWASAPSAAQADALSTAFMIMTRAEIQEYCRCHPPVSAFLLEQTDHAVRGIHDPA